MNWPDDGSLNNCSPSRRPYCERASANALGILIAVHSFEPEARHDDSLLPQNKLVIFPVDAWSRVDREI
jgi:hypothetical protein